MKDDTTCIVVDIIPPDNSIEPLPTPKKQNKLRALFFRKKSHDSANKLSKKLSAVGIVEEIFEEGSAMLAERSAFCPLGFSYTYFYFADNLGSKQLLTATICCYFFSSFSSFFPWKLSG